MKTLKSLFSVILMTLTMVVLTSCGGDDPEPQKSDLELVKEGVIGTTWSVASITTSDGTVTVTDNFCNSGYNYMGDLMLEFISETKVNQSSCGTYFPDLSYTLTESNGVFKIKRGNIEFELLTPPDDMDGITVQLKRTDNIDGANGSIWTFNKM